MDPIVDAHRLSVAEVVAALETDLERGLASAEAAARLTRFGPNELTAEEREPAWRRFFRQLQDTLVILLLVATAVSAVLWFIEGDSAAPYEALAILGIVILNAVMGYLQESRAEAAVAALQAMSAATATVIRDGERRQVPAVELVPGDLILIEEGDTIPADARVVVSTALQTAEAALTGESVPVSKETAPIEGDVGVADRTNMIFSGTAATYGRGRAIVTATGMSTEVGRIAGMLSQTPDVETPLSRELNRTGKRLGIGVVAIAAVMVVTILVVNDVAGPAAFFDVLILGVALAVAAVPEGLPAVVTAVLAIAVQRMARRNAIVRHLSAVETLGAASVIASDKTGTLTRNEMTVRRVVTASGSVRLEGTGYVPSGDVVPEPITDEVGKAEDGYPSSLREEVAWALTAADLANNAALLPLDGAWTAQGDPTEAALITAARKAGLDPAALDARFPRVGEIPFSSERKLMSTVHADTERPGLLLVFTKGAPDILLSRCSAELVGREHVPLSDARRDEIQRTNDRMAEQALRTLGVAFRRLPENAGVEQPSPDLEADMVFLGLIGMIDPPRPEAKAAVRRARDAGIRPLMITGDHPVTASVIARELGIAEDGRTLTGADLARMDDEELDRAVGEVAVYARVNPADKLRIVGSLQRSGAVVAMTGDGVNDAPALKSADIGVAMGITGTDVSKEAADMVLTDDNFATIVAAVEEGRAVFENIRKFLRYLLSSNVGEVMTMFFGVLLADLLGLAEAGEGVVLPLLATQILWINLLTDGAPALALGVDPAEPGQMQRPPRPPGEGVITSRMWRGILFVGVIMAAGTLLVLDASLPGGLIEGEGSLSYAQTMAFTTLMFFQVFNVFNARSDEASGLRHIFVNRWLTGAIALSVALQVAVVYLPFLQDAFGTVALGAGDWAVSIVAASSVLWLREAQKAIARASG